MKKLKRLLCLILIPILLTAVCLAETAVPDPSPLIRVWLKRQGLTDRADLLLETEYTLTCANGTRLFLTEGSEPTVVLRSGQLIVFCDGMSLECGSRLTLTRHTAQNDSSAGFRLTTGGNLFPGDLTLTVTDGQIRPVLTLSMEDYLKGVVPYEMSDAFPLEALKAQAVCARTYALSRLTSGRDYDLSDTTDDQVFFGINPANSNALLAVEETAGVVGLWDGKPAVCYYAASNGGQTDTPAHVWGSSLPYYAVTDDPYDVENSESITLRCRLQKTSPQLTDAFRDLLHAKVVRKLSAEGFDTAPESFRVDSIESISLQKPRYAAPSRLYTEMTVTFTFSGRKLLSGGSPDTAGQSVPAVMDAFASLGKSTVTLSLFPDVIRALGLSVYGADNELVSLEETDTEFTLVSRRYGHGVGMSQRGAQTMAATYGMDYFQILSFYYPGMTLGRTAYGAREPATPDPLLAATPGPSASPTPRPTLMPVSADTLPENSRLASVEGIDDDSSLNLRAAPNAAAEILRRLFKHQQLIVLDDCGEEGWVHVRTDTVEGYVMVRFLEYITP